MAYEVPAPADLPIFLDRRAADAIERHALSDTSVELGGILLGKECLDPATGQPFVWITQSLEAKHYANTQASFTYTHDSWEEITRERDRLFPDYDIVGWYHTHPSFGIFLSHHDLFIHQNFFAQPLQVAYVVDPDQPDARFFPVARRRHGAGRRLLSDRRSRRPDRAGAAGQRPRKTSQSRRRLGRSVLTPPRGGAHQDAQRPAQRDVSSPVEQAPDRHGLRHARARSWACWAWPPALWLFQLQAGSRSRTNHSRPWPARSSRSAASQRLAIDTLLEKAGGDNPAEFVAQYDRAAKDRDDACASSRISDSINDTLGTRVKDLETQRPTGPKRSRPPRKTLARSKKTPRSAPKLRDQIAVLEKSNATRSNSSTSFAAGSNRRTARGRGRPARSHPHPLCGLRGLGLQRLARPGSGRFFLLQSRSARTPRPDDVDTSPPHQIV